ncbi:unnamed protein product [Kuraishia capsulata CBS 1993]|uniref:Uncharacterized protein n=1 Tax=Kuraishia capsulata CBS 1993 TaxID=1382522 RepID=W6MLQ1_9ASCO|nr:uncharacterized protein KUCA_T00003020001 [Kuraishia capsulata CBS 1993]CDK27043.1 unnamed protein product [Kuraishia capsulata CBS 1993]
MVFTLLYVSICQCQLYVTRQRSSLYSPYHLAMDILQCYSSDSESDGEKNDPTVSKRVEIPISNPSKITKAKVPTSKLKADHLFGLKPQLRKSQNTQDEHVTDIEDVFERIRNKSHFTTLTPDIDNKEDQPGSDEKPTNDKTEQQTVEFNVDKFYQQNNTLIDSGDLDSAKQEKENRKVKYYAVGHNQLSDVFKYNDKRHEHDD